MIFVYTEEGMKGELYALRKEGCPIHMIRDAEDFLKMVCRDGDLAPSVGWYDNRELDIFWITGDWSLEFSMEDGDYALLTADRHASPHYNIQQYADPDDILTVGREWVEKMTAACDKNNPGWRTQTLPDPPW